MCEPIDGGPAFPGPNGFLDMPNVGLSLRDYFAVKAMPIASTFYDTNEEVVTEVAKWCYRMADEMLKARQA